jgi:cytokinin dehydrogenase
MVKCSMDVNSDLFMAALGGLGQFGVITRARIRLEPAPRRVRWVRLAYTDVATFTKDQEFLISNRASQVGFDYVEGQVQLSRSLVEGPKSTPFFSGADLARLAGLASRTGPTAIYYIEGAMYYTEDTAISVDKVQISLNTKKNLELYCCFGRKETHLLLMYESLQKMKALLDQLSFEPGFAFTKDVTFVQFLDRVREEERVLRSAGAWEVPHPWLNLFVPRSRILDFDDGVFKILLKDTNPAGIILMYPMNKDMWDDRMTAMTPATDDDDDDVFYAVSFLWSALSADDVPQLERWNKAVLDFCDRSGIECKQYLPHYTSQDGWRRHFGAKWGRIAELKARYDPQALLSPGQRIFPVPVEASGISSA